MEKKRCELTDLLIDQCSHCLKQDLGDEVTSYIPFNGLLVKPRQVDNGDRT